MDNEIKRIKSLFPATIVIIKKSWWKLIILLILYSFIATVNFWFGSQFFVALIAGWLLGRFLGDGAADSDLPITKIMTFLASYLLIIIFLYLYFSIYTSLKFQRLLILPWNIWKGLKIISDSGFEILSRNVSGANSIFKGFGVYTIWISEVIAILFSSSFSVGIYGR